MSTTRKRAWLIWIKIESIDWFKRPRGVRSFCRFAPIVKVFLRFQVLQTTTTTRRSSFCLASRAMQMTSSIVTIRSRKIVVASKWNWPRSNCSLHFKSNKQRNRCVLRWSSNASINVFLWQADRYLSQLERSRDLSRTFCHVDMDAFYASVEVILEHLLLSWSEKIHRFCAPDAR